MAPRSAGVHPSVAKLFRQASVNNAGGGVNRRGTPGGMVPDAGDTKMKLE